jgi:hypothetical protein
LTNASEVPGVGLAAAAAFAAAAAVVAGGAGGVAAALAYVLPWASPRKRFPSSPLLLLLLPL